jgi:hypothetical protein
VHLCFKVCKICLNDFFLQRFDLSIKNTEFDAKIKSIEKVAKKLRKNVRGGELLQAQKMKY